MKERLQEAVEEEAKMDMTPMIDCVFLLIIFFLCIDFKILEAKLPAYLPKDVGTHTTDVEPQEKLNLKIVCTKWGQEIARRKLLQSEIDAGMTASYRLVDHTIHWQVGPKIYREKDKLLKELKRIAKDPNKKQRDPKTGEMKTMGVVIEPGPRTTYGDVALTLDAVNAAGFDDISFGGGLGARKQGKKGD